MSEENSGIQVGEEGAVVFIRVEGKGTYLNSHLLKQYFLQCLAEDRCIFQVDLSHCNYMDSTFLGMLAGFGIKVKARSSRLIQLVNATDRIRGMLESLGIDHLFQMTQRARSTGDLTHLKGDTVSMEAKSCEMLEAHEKLVEISPINQAKFRDVIALLRKKVDKSGGL